MINAHGVITDTRTCCKHSGNSNQASCAVSKLFATGGDSGGTAADINKHFSQIIQYARRVAADMRLGLDLVHMAGPRALSTESDSASQSKC